MLKNPTLENEDHTFFDSNTENGKYMTILKSELSKEISKEFKIDTFEVIKNAVTLWEEQIRFMYSYLLFSKKVDIESDLKYINDKLESLILSIKGPECNEDFPHNLFETIYFKLLQHENIGRESDLIKIQEFVNDRWKSETNFAEKTPVEMKNLIINVSAIEQFIDKNVSTIAEITYSAPQKKDRRKIRGCKKKVKVLIKWLRENNQYDFENGIPAGLIVCCIYEIVHLNKKEIYSNTFHGYKSKPTINTEIQRQDDAHRANQILMCKRVIRRYFEFIDYDGYDYLLKLRTKK